MASTSTRHEALLLTRDRKFDDCDLQPDVAGAAVEQLVLPGVQAPPERPVRRRSGPGKTRRSVTIEDDPLLAAFLRRLAAQGRAPRGQAAYRYQMRSVLAVGSRMAGRAVTCAGLFLDERLLGYALVDDTAPTRGTRLSKWTLAQRRSAIRDFATLMRPELLTLLGEEPNARLDRALRSVAERVGGGYRLTGGAPRKRGGPAPTEEQLRAVLDAVASAPGYRGARNLAFFTILAETGSRVNALRSLDGADCIEMPSGRLRIFLSQKGGEEAREVGLSRTATEALRNYIAAFNRYAALRRWRVRVSPGSPGAVWRNSPRGTWPVGAIRSTLRDGCATAQVPELTPHAFRRAFATDAASVLPRHIVAQAGGWQGLERLDDHYVQPRAATILRKLGGAGQPLSQPGNLADEPSDPAFAL